MEEINQKKHAGKEETIRILCIETIAIVHTSQ